MSAVTQVSLSPNRAQTQTAIQAAITAVEMSYQRVGLSFQPSQNIIVINGTEPGFCTNPTQVLTVENQYLIDNPALVQSALDALDVGGQEPFQIIKTPYNYVILHAKVINLAGGGGVTPNPAIENRQVTIAEAAAGQLTLTFFPVSVVGFFINAGPTLAQGVDYSVGGNVVDWSATPLLGLLEPGEYILFIYRRL